MEKKNANGTTAKKKSRGGKYAAPAASKKKSTAPAVAKEKSAASAAPKKKSIVAAIICGACALALVLILGTVWFFGKGPGANLLNFGNTTLAGIDLTGMTKEQAAQALAPLAEQYTATPMQLDANGKSFTLNPQDSGIALNVSALVDAAYKSGETPITDFTPYLSANEDAVRGMIADIAAQVDTEYVPTVTRVESDSAKNTQVLYITRGASSCHIAQPEAFDAIMQAFGRGNFNVVLPCTVEHPDELDFAGLQEKYYTAPIDATMDPKTFALTEGVDGYGFDLKEAEKLLKELEVGQTGTLFLSAIKPEVTADALWEGLFQDMLASSSTEHTSDESRNNNLRLACASIDGIVLMPGDVFSYNEALGERTPEKGYMLGGTYDAGRVVYDYGGGICQVSSGVYYCALISDLEIVERSCHMYNPNYLDCGLDATVNWGTLDLRIRNNSAHPIRIRAEVAGGCVNISFWGTDDKDYYVKMDPIIVYWHDYKTIYEEYAPDNEEGYYDGQTITSPVVGFGVDTYRCKYSKETNQEISREFEDYSEYDHRDAVICKIVTTEDSSGEDEGGETIPGSGDVSPDSGGSDEGESGGSDGGSSEGGESGGEE